MMSQLDDVADLWLRRYPIPDDQAVAARLVLAGASTHAPGTDTSTCTCAGCIADARLLMQACGLVHDPLADRFIVMPSGHVKRGPNAKRVGSQT